MLLSMRNIIAVVSPKGGVGKTSLSGNLGYALASMGSEEVTLIDLDVSTGLTYGFQRLVVPEGTSTGALLTGTSTIGDCLVEGLPGGMALLPANKSDLTSAEFALQAAGVTSAYRLRDALAGLDGTVIVDTPGKANQVFANALVAADWALISLNPDADSIREASEVLIHVGEVRKYANERLRVLGVVRNIWEWSTNASKAADEIVQSFTRDNGVHLFRTCIPRDTKHREARFLGGLATELAPSARISVAFRSLAEEVLAVLGAGGAGE